MTETTTKPKPKKPPKPIAEPAVRLDGAKLESQELSDEQDAGVRTICAVTGCGRLVAIQRLAKISATDLKKLAAADKSKKYKPAIEILYRK